MSLLRDKHIKGASRSTKTRYSGAKKTKSTDKREKPINSNTFPVVALGASAGGLEALQEFFNHLPNDLGIAYVIITHLEPNHTSQLTEILRSNTKMVVEQITEGTRIKPNTVYVIPPNKNVELRKNTLFLKVQSEPHFAVLPINFFLESLAQNIKHRTIAIILSGTGYDGTDGIRAIKCAQGTVIVQEPKSAKYNAMPKHAIETGMVDYVLHVEEMPDLLAKLSNDAALDAESGNNKKDNFDDIFEILRKYTG